MKEKLYMNKLYGTHLCKDCQEVIKYLDKIDYDYAFIEITENIQNLKEFIIFRDEREEFDEAKAEKYINIPCLVKEDGEILFYDEILELK